MKYEVFKKNVGKNIMRVRRDKHISQEELAHRIGVSRVYMGYIEQGRNMCSFKVLLLLADALKVKPQKLLFP